MFKALRQRLFGDEGHQKLRSENVKLTESVAQLTQEKTSAVQNLEEMHKRPRARSARSNPGGGGQETRGRRNDL